MTGTSGRSAGHEFIQSDAGLCSRVLIKRCAEIVKGINVTMQLHDAIDVAPAFRRYMKDIVTNKVTTGEGIAMITHECSAVLQNRAAHKLGDPESFVISIKSNGVSFDRSLCDLGSSVNLMPLSISRKLGMTNFKPTRISLVLADRSVRYPDGVLKDVPLQIMRNQIPTDFVVLKLDEEPRTRGSRLQPVQGIEHGDQGSTIGRSNGFS